MPLPLFELIIKDDDHSGVTATALVDSPAIEMNWQAFEKAEPIKFLTFSQEKRIVRGPLMIPNTPIYSADSKGEYNVWFSAKTIEQIRNKVHKNQYTNRVNPMHESMMLLPDIYMVSDYLIDRENGLDPKGFEKAPNGSWMAEFKVSNDQIWNEYIKTGIFKGFSVEGFFEDVESQLTEDQVKKLAKFLQLFPN